MISLEILKVDRTGRRRTLLDLLLLFLDGVR